MDKPDLADVLAEINRLRAEHKIGDPLASIPKGTPLDTGKCPLALALEGWCGPTMCNPGRKFDDALSADELPRTPEIMRRFMGAFDEGAYPELIA